MPPAKATTASSPVAIHRVRFTIVCLAFYWGDWSHARGDAWSFGAQRLVAPVSGISATNDHHIGVLNHAVPVWSGSSHQDTANLTGVT